MELFRTDDSHALADRARLSAQLDTSRAAGAVKVVGYDLAVLGNAGLDSLEKWNLKSTVEPPTLSIKSKSRAVNKKIRKMMKYYKLNGARVRLDRQ